MNQNDKLSAYHVVNDYEEEQLRSVFYDYGELRQAPAIARTIVSMRKVQPIETSSQLKEVVKRFLGTYYTSVDIPYVDPVDYAFVFNFW